ncbi:MAG: flagellar filament capping protein FliD, partial [Planctomycetales bacterium]|nr:flagellar filament capping protein FliD [Planctomycetales bacterium]
DALVQFGGDSGAPQLLTSSSNTFKDVTTGLDITLAGESTDPVTVNVANTSSSISSQLQLFVDQYNKVRDKIDKLTFFNESDQTKGLLFGSSETLRVESDLSRLVTGRFFGVGKVQSLAQVGVNVDKDGKLSFDKSKLESAYQDDPEGVQKFFGDDKLGFGVKVNAAMETLVGLDNSVLVNRSSTLNNQVEDIAKRIEALNGRLDQVSSATPQRLRLMLIEGAIRLARQTADSWREGRAGDGLESLIRCRSFITELISGIREGSSPLADKVLGIYLFLFQELTYAQQDQNVARLEGVIRVLEEERTTWQEVCMTLTDRPEEISPRNSHEITAPAYLKVPSYSAQAESISFEA